MYSTALFVIFDNNKKHDHVLDSFSSALTELKENWLVPISNLDTEEDIIWPVACTVTRTQQQTAVSVAVYQSTHLVDKGPNQLCSLL